jgi:hypothetical protein
MIVVSRRGRRLPGHRQRPRPGSWLSLMLPSSATALRGRFCQCAPTWRTLHHADHVGIISVDIIALAAGTAGASVLSFSSLISLAPLSQPGRASRAATSGLRRSVSVGPLAALESAGTPDGGCSVSDLAPLAAGEVAEPHGRRPGFCDLAPLSLPSCTTQNEILLQCVTIWRPSLLWTCLKT